MFQLLFPCVYDAAAWEALAPKLQSNYSAILVLSVSRSYSDDRKQPTLKLLCLGGLAMDCIQFTASACDARDLTHEVKLELLHQAQSKTPKVTAGNNEKNKKYTAASQQQRLQGHHCGAVDNVALK